MSLNKKISVLTDKGCSSMLFINACSVVVAEEEEDSKDEEDELGGLFKVSRPEKNKRVGADALDCSRFQPDSNHDWDQEEVKD